MSARSQKKDRRIERTACGSQTGWDGSVPGDGSSPEIGNLKRLLSGLDPALFDGHTEFFSLTMEERLAWASQIAAFVSLYCGLAAASFPLHSSN